MKKIIALGLIAMTTQSAIAYQGGKKISDLPDGFVSYIIQTKTSSETVTARCAGVRIAPQYILTAGHCVYRASAVGASSAILVINSGSVKSTATKVSKVIINPEYLGSLSSTTNTKDSSKDVAIFKTEADFPFLGIARLDLTQAPSPSKKYLSIGVPLYVKDSYNKKQIFHAGLISPTAIPEGQEYDSYRKLVVVFGKDAVPTQGDSGGPLYSLNPRTQKYDTVVALVASGIIGGIFFKSRNQGVSFYNPIGPQNPKVQQFILSTLAVEGITASR